MSTKSTPESRANPVGRRRLPLPASALLLAAIGATALADDPARPMSVIVTSPDGRLRAEVNVEAVGKSAVPRYQVTFRGRPVAGLSHLGVGLADGSTLGENSFIAGFRSRSIDESYTQFPGKRSRVIDRCSESIVLLQEKTSGRRWEVVFRAYDDGVAFRYRFPAQEGWPRLEIAGDRAEFRLPDDAIAVALPLPSHTTPHEGRYRKGPISELPKGGLIGLPLLAELPGTGWASILEADVTNDAGLYLSPTGDGNLAAKLSPLPKEPKIAVRADLPHDSPWRVFLIADKVERLVESDLVLNLNPPRAFDDTSWIKPGKTTFPWWNGFYEKGTPFPMGLNTATAKYYIDFCAEAGIPYHSLDGLDNIAWYGGTIVPYEGAGITQGIEGLDLPEVIRYAKSKGVKLRLWMHWLAAEKHMDRAFPLYREWGIEGVMVDFIDRDDQDISRYMHRLLKTAADNHLTVTVHGAKEPTGLERTYPNLLTTEAVMNLEYDKWDPIGIPPEHELTIPFIRMLAGPLDFHQGSLRGVPVSDFKPRNAAPLVMGTPCHMLASYVVFQNHLPMVADYPSAYRGHPALPVLAKIPATWDDTRCLSASVGEFVVMARRQGGEWWVGAMTDRKGRELDVPLNFLGPGRFRATTYRDDPKAEFRFAEESSEVGPDRVRRITLAPAGGTLIHLTPIAQ